MVYSPISDSLLLFMSTGSAFSSPHLLAVVSDLPPSETLLYQGLEGHGGLRPIQFRGSEEQYNANHILSLS